MPKETRNYVPNFIAVTYLMEHHAEHGIFPRKPLPGEMSLDTLMVEGPICNLWAHWACQVNEAATIWIALARLLRVPLQELL